jgi:uncharacterized OsmC-like protein
MPTAHTTYLGQLRTEATHLQSGTRLVTDAPTDNNGRGEAFSPTDLLATALGSCMLTIMGIQAERRGIDLTGSELNSTKIMQAQPRKISRVEITLRMQTAEPLDEAQRQHLEHAAHTCPVALSLHPDIEQALTFEWRVAERV